MNYAALIKAIDSATAQLQGRAVAAVNRALVLRNWMIGAYLIEFEQNGRDRAKYGTRLLENLAKDLAARGIKGLGLTTIKLCRLLVHAYPDIRHALSDEFTLVQSLPKIRQTLPDKSKPDAHAALPPPLEPSQLLRLSWSHLQELITINDPWKRALNPKKTIRNQ